MTWKRWAPYVQAGNLARQVGAALLLRDRIRWRSFGRWLGGHSLGSVPVAAGAVGMGCIGFPVHPVWEVTQACNLRCVHCHAASAGPMDNELTTEEGFRLIDALARERRFGMLVYTGGEPMVRPDLFDLLARSRDRGLVNVIATNGTLIGSAEATELKRLGVGALAVSLDHTDPSIHNRIRGETGAYERAVAAMDACRRAGILLQVNFTAMPDNLDNVPEMIRFVDRMGAGIMLCYQLVPMGRGRGIRSLDADTNAGLMETVARCQADAATIVEPVAAPQYWAHLLRRDGGSGPIRRALARRVFRGCSAGWGLVYVKPDGEVWPCPFVPVSGGNVRRTPLGRIWRESPIFRDLRDRTRLKGACGTCDDRSVCGGCRGRAWAATGDPLAEDPACFLAGHELDRTGSRADIEWAAEGS